MRRRDFIVAAGSASLMAAAQSGDESGFTSLFDGRSLAVSAALTIASLLWTDRYFRRVATSFADVI